MENRDEDFTQGQAVAIQVPAPAAPKPSRWPILVAVALVVLLGGGLAAWLLSRKAEVPGGVGKTSAEARSLLAKFRVEDKEIVEYDDPNNTTAAQVVRQVPPPPEQAEPGSVGVIGFLSATVTISPSQSLVGQDKDTAMRRLVLLGLRPTPVKANLPTGNTDLGHVVRYSPGFNGEPIPRGSEINLEIKSEETTTVPRCIG